MIREGAVGPNGAKSPTACPDPNRWLGLVFGMTARLTGNYIAPVAPAAPRAPPDDPPPATRPIFASSTTRARLTLMRVVDGDRTDCGQDRKSTRLNSSHW